MTDALKMDYINSLPEPFMVRFCGDSWWWPVHDFEVSTALMRIDVCGLLEVRSFGEVAEIKSLDGDGYDPESFWSDYEGE